MRTVRPLSGALVALALASVLSAQTQQTVDRVDDLFFPQRTMQFEEFEDGSILVTDLEQQIWFPTFDAYARSSYFQENGLRCGTDSLPHPAARGTTGDCSNSNTNPAAEYAPSGGTLYQIPVVFHVLHDTNGAGNISDALINSQIDVLNEDFRAMAGTNGAGGTDTRIEFTLAAVTRTASKRFFNDRGDYWTGRAWDTTRYLNIYSNKAGGNLGYAYVPSGGGVVGNTWDRVVIYWAAVGRPAPYGSPYDLGRSGTHEVGHYLGLYHTFQGGCASGSAPACWSNGDLICDTNPEGSANFSPCSRSTCGSPDPTNNYMDYSDDVCMNAFTEEQARRMRCTLANFRVDLGDTGGNLPGKATGPSPANGATGVSTSASLSWSAGNGATSHDVYFGTNSTPGAGEFQGNQAGTSFSPGTLANSTTYYWRIDEVNANGTTTGDVWSFTTTSGGGGGIALTANGYKVKGVQHADLSWSGAAGAVDVFRDGNLIAGGVSGSTYTDNIGVKGGGSYVYQVCEAGGGPCSNTANVVF